MLRRNIGYGLARKFLYLLAILIVLTIAARLAYSFWGQQLMNFAMVPRAEFHGLPPVSAEDYRKPALWHARPDIPNNPAGWLPAGIPANDLVTPGRIAIFFIHPTSYLGSDRWNAGVDDAESRDRARLFIRGEASAFNGVGAVWAPKYRQATFGAFLTDQANAARAIDAAYHDVDAAFTAFLEANPAGPIILAGHSQGSLHLLRLMKERVAGTPILQRVVAAYPIGWPISLSADIPALGLPACTARGQAGCIISWQSFALPADPQAIVRLYDGSTGLTGDPRRGTPMLCVNPLTGAPGLLAVPAAGNLGTLKPNDTLTEAKLIRGAVPAACDPRGFLTIGDPPEMGPYVLPGNNYHVYDYSLFWANIRRDVSERLTTYLKAPQR